VLALHVLMLALAVQVALERSGLMTTASPSRDVASVKAVLFIGSLVLILDDLAEQAADAFVAALRELFALERRVSGMVVW